MKSKSNLSNISYDTDPLPEQTTTSAKQVKDSSAQPAPNAPRKSDAAASGQNAESDIDDVPELRQSEPPRPSTPPPIPQRSSWRPSSIGSPISPRSPSSLSSRYDLPAEQLEYGSRPGSAIARQEAAGRFTPISRGNSRAGSVGSMNPDELARLREEQARLQERKRRLQEMHEIEEREAEVGKRISLIEESGLPH